MARSGLTSFVALLLCLSPAGGLARAAPPAVRLDALLGASPQTVRSTIMGSVQDWPLRRGFEVATAQASLLFLSLDKLVLDPVIAERLAAFRTHGAPEPWRDHLLCGSRLERGGEVRDGHDVVLMFRDNRLEAAFGPQPTPSPTSAPVAVRGDRESLRAFRPQPVVSPYVARPGQLPMADFLGFMSRWGRSPLAGEDRFSAVCHSATSPPRLSRARDGKSGLNASDMQGLAGAPFIVSLPFINQGRKAARRRGSQLLAQLSVGATLSATPEAFAAAHKGVRVYRDGASDYAVLSIDLGGAPTRNLSDYRDAALLGVRGGRIVWIAPPTGLGPKASLLCLDAQGVPGTPRRGCSGFGVFSP